MRRRITIRITTVHRQTTTVVSAPAPGTAGVPPACRPEPTPCDPGKPVRIKETKQ
jgi:hypothetical protein